MLPDSFVLLWLMCVAALRLKVRRALLVMTRHTFRACRGHCTGTHTFVSLMHMPEYEGTSFFMGPGGSSAMASVGGAESSPLASLCGSVVVASKQARSKSAGGVGPLGLVLRQPFYFATT